MVTGKKIFASVGEKTDRKGTWGDFFRVMGEFYILIKVIVSWVVFVEIYQTVLVRFVHFLL